MSELKWSSEKPKEAGRFYYYRATPLIPKQVAEIKHRRRELIAHLTSGPGFHYISMMTGQWSGPIPEPTEDTLPHYIDKAVEADLNERIKND